MADKRKEKIQKLLALAADVNDEESMSALAKAQQLMMDYDLTEDEIFNYHEQQRIEAVETHVIYRDVRKNGCIVYLEIKIKKAS
nr:DUF2786 domain-containing protein [Enterococcus faecium]